MRQRSPAAFLAICALVASGCAGDGERPSAAADPSPTTAPTLLTDASPSSPRETAGPLMQTAVDPTPTPSAVAEQSTAGETNVNEDPGPPSDARRLELKRVITGDISPKSVEASGRGLFFAQNMMYRHTVTVYDREGDLVATIPDEVSLDEYGFEEYAGDHRGAPVEAAFSSDGAYAYVSNYSMYGSGFGAEGSDTCSPASDYDNSFVYRIDTSTLEIDEVIEVGAVPKYVAVTPDDRYVLVSNWCSYSLSVISVEDATEVEQVPLDAYPRGIAVSPDASRAYVAVMGTTNIAVVDLDDFSVEWITGIGAGPRHLVMDPDGSYLYVTLNRDGTVAKIDLESHEVVARVATGGAPRSMAIADDGRSLYVVNYHSSSVSKVTTADMEVVQTAETNQHPIGITYDTATRQVWVACYSGSIMIFEDKPES